MRITHNVTDFFFYLILFDLTCLDCHEQGWYLYGTMTGDESKRTSEE